MYNKNAWKKYKDKKEIFKFAEGYKYFLDHSKTERLATNEVEALLKKNGFKPLDKVTSLKVGDKVYVTNRNKNVCALIIGKKDITEGMHILGAHIDSPRLDLKQNPLYEDTGFALLDTHYYGGIKTYQWLTLPLALIGVVVKKDGTKINVNIGLDLNDPIFSVNDLLIHLAKQQMQKPLEKAVEAEQLDITFGSMPLNDSDGRSVKENILKILKDKYHFDEVDLTSAEIEAVPAYPCKDYGLDRSMVGGYGQDDRSCAYCSLKAFLDVDVKNLTYTSCLILTDKEEVGSQGATGAHSHFIENVIINVCMKMKQHKNNPFLSTRIALGKSRMISSDVTAAADPLNKDVISPNKNMARFCHGVCINKYTGVRGKSGANDASAEYLGYIRNILEKHDINYQSSELGYVDAGGGGTISYILAKYNMDIVDAGVPLLSMHSPLEVVSKVDLFEAYLFYKAFLNNRE